MKEKTRFFADDSFSTADHYKKYQDRMRYDVVSQNAKLYTYITRAHLYAHKESTVACSHCMYKFYIAQTMNKTKKREVSLDSASL
jgi:hypothetical protein